MGHRRRSCRLAWGRVFGSDHRCRDFGRHGVRRRFDRRSRKSGEPFLRHCLFHRHRHRGLDVAPALGRFCTSRVLGLFRAFSFDWLYAFTALAATTAFTATAALAATTTPAAAASGFAAAFRPLLLILWPGLGARLQFALRPW